MNVPPKKDERLSEFAIQRSQHESKGDFPSVARWPFFGPFLANVAIFESHFLEKKLFGYKLKFGYFVAIFENFFL